MADPTTIPFDKLDTALRSLGIDTQDVQEITIGLGSVAVTRIRRDEDGKAVLARRQVATTTALIGVEREKDMP